MEKQERTVIHVQLKTDIGIEKFSKEHHYFGSLAAIYCKFAASDLGIGYGSLRNVKLSELNLYENKFCVIRKDVLKTIEKSGGK